jgi:hypothetical protein
MDRRSLVVGGGAAALAAGLASVGNVRTQAAAAAGIGAEPASTADHARRFLASFNVELGLVNPDAAQGNLKESIAAYQASAPRDPDAEDLHAWAKHRLADLTGTGTFETVLRIPQSQTVLSFGFLLYTQHQEVRLPMITQRMSVPATLANLEPDFFPELLNQIEIKRASSRDFASQLQAGAGELDRLVAAVSKGPAASARQDRGLEGATLAILIFCAVGIYAELKGE